MSGSGTDVDLVWIESVADGTAAAAHLAGTRERLEQIPGVRIRQVLSSDRPGADRAHKLLAVARLGARVLLSRPKGDLVTRWHPLGLIAVLKYRAFGRRRIVLIQGSINDLYMSHPWTRRTSLFDRLYRTGLRAASAVVTPADGIRDWVVNFAGLPADSVTVLPNGVPRTVDVPKPPEDGRPYAVMVGNLARWQGVDIAVQAAAEPEWPDDVDLVVIGDGEAADDVAAAAQTSPRVRYLGRLDHDTAMAWTAGAVTSLSLKKMGDHTEFGVSPFKVLEAAQVGVPVVATDVPGQAELVASLGGAVVIPAGDPVAVARAVRDLHADPDRAAQLGATARGSIARFEWAAGAPTLAEVLSSPAPR